LATTGETEPTDGAARVVVGAFAAVGVGRKCPPPNPVEPPGIRAGATELETVVVALTVAAVAG